MKIKNKSLQTWAKLLPFLAPYKWQMILIIALMILGACFDMVQPLFSGYAVDNFIEPRTTEGLIPFTAVYLSMVVVQTITTILMAIYALKVEMYLGRDLKRKLFDHLQTLDFSYYNTTPVGTIMARLMSDTGKIGTVLAWSLVDIFWSSMYVLGCVVIMLFVNWKLALILIAIIPIIAVITVVFQKKILAVNRRVRAINAEVTRHYNEGISGAKTSKTLVIEEKNDKAFEKVAEDMRSTTIRAVRLNAVYIPIISFLTAIGVVNGNTDGTFAPEGNFTRAEAATLIEYLWNGDGAAIMGSECGIPASKAGLATAQAAGKINELVAEANGKVMSFVSCQLDPLFESSDLKATGTGTYQEVFDTVDYDNKSGADVVDVLLDGMSAVGYTV